MKTVKKYRRILIFLTVLWMLLIFYMSSQAQDDSNAQSSMVCELLCEVFVEDYDQMPAEEQLEMQTRLVFPVRKGAHLTEYLILGTLLTLSAASVMAEGREIRRKPCENQEIQKPRENPEIRNSREIREIMDKQTARIFAGAARRALMIGFLYAVSDEIHQIFVPGRAGQLRDVLIDTAGVLLGTCLARASGRLLRAGEKTGEGTSARDDRL